MIVHHKTKQSIDTNRWIWVENVDELRDETPVGAEIEFVSDRYCRILDDVPMRFGKRVIKGTVEAKFEHVFMLTNGNTYSWKEYMLGKLK